MALRILLADDSEIVREAIRNLLVSGTQEWAICGEVADAEQLIACAGEAKPDVLLLDLSVARPSGLGFVKTLQGIFPDLAIVLMSAQEPAVLRHLADSVGVRHFVSKSRLATGLIAQLEAISLKKSP
jgi:two-component system response regulator EvgA